MMVTFRICRAMLVDIRRDLERPHKFAFERVGFLFCRFGAMSPQGLLILAHEYMAVADEDYIDDENFGAVIGPGAFRQALERTLMDALGVFHVHMHAHRGIPSPSRIDLLETSKFVPDFFHVQSALPHGALILSHDTMSGRVWLRKNDKSIPITTATVVGAPLVFSAIVP